MSFLPFVFANPLMLAALGAWATPAVTGSTVWLLLFDADFGPVNKILGLGDHSWTYGRYSAFLLVLLGSIISRSSRDDTANSVTQATSNEPSEPLAELGVAPGASDSTNNSAAARK